MNRSSLRPRIGGICFAAMVALLIPMGVEAQGLTYDRGQAVQPAYEGWMRNADGSYTLWFGYLNRNWEETPNIPVGPDNFMSPGPGDVGQPTYFLPRRNRLVFGVQVPGTFSEDDELVWTLRTQGEELTAHARLSSDFFLDHIVIMSENGSIGNGATTPEIRANTPPVSQLEGGTVRHVRVGEPLALAVTASDDGVPRSFFSRGSDREFNPPTAEGIRSVGRPSQKVPGRVNLLHAAWWVYRGDGEVVTFDPPQIKVWEDTRPYTSPWAQGWVPPKEPADGRWATQVTFDQPGTYVLHVRVSDGGLHVDHEVTVHVTAEGVAP